MRFAGDTLGQTVALSGLFQSLALIQELARSGGISDTDAYSCSMASVLKLDASSCLAVYDGSAGIDLGLRCLLPHLEQRMNGDGLEQARYAARLMVLERKLNAQPAVLAGLSRQLCALAQHDSSCAAHDIEQVALLARVYVEHVSPLGPKLLISGNPTHLKRDAVAAQIRALLLAGIRALVLWRQSGGGRVRLMLLRKHYARITRHLLQGQTY